METIGDASSSRIWRHFRKWSWLAYVGSPVGTLLGFVGVIADALGMRARIVICVLGFLAWVLSSLFANAERRAQVADRQEIEDLRLRLSEVGGLDSSAPDHALRLLVPFVFAAGAMWRLTIYVLEQEGDALWLRRKMRCAASEIYESSGRELIDVDSSLFREIRTVGLPFVNEASDGPDKESALEDWLAWQVRVVRDEGTAKVLHMPTRKYAWCAVRESGHRGRTVALMAETVQPGAINVNQLRAPLMEPLLSLVVRLAEFPEAINPVFKDTENVLGRLS